MVLLWDSLREGVQRLGLLLVPLGLGLFFSVEHVIEVLRNPDFWHFDLIVVKIHLRNDEAASLGPLSADLGLALLWRSSPLDQQRAGLARLVC